MTGPRQMQESEYRIQKNPEPQTAELRTAHCKTGVLARCWSLDISYRPKGENRTAHGLQPWEDIPESIALRGRPSAGHYSQRKTFVESDSMPFQSEFPLNAGTATDPSQRRPRAQGKGLGHRIL